MLEVRSLETSVDRAVFSPKSLRENILAAPGVLCLWLSCSNLCSRLHTMLFSVSVSSLLSLIRVLVTGFRAHWINQDNFILRSLTAFSKTLFPNKVKFTGYRGWDRETPF